MLFLVVTKLSGELGSKARMKIDSFEILLLYIGEISETYCQIRGVSFCIQKNFLNIFREYIIEKIE